MKSSDSPWGYSKEKAERNQGIRNRRFAPTPQIPLKDLPPRKPIESVVYDESYAPFASWTQDHEYEQALRTKPLGLSENEFEKMCNPEERK